VPRQQQLPLVHPPFQPHWELRLMYPRPDINQMLLFPRRDLRRLRPNPVLHPMTSALIVFQRRPLLPRTRYRFMRVPAVAVS
jgi:hypothetical protein